jgi:amino acid transporter/mannitol/fructose-specific phosphotransferase system IIA component (Ntr-type)
MLKKELGLLGVFCIAAGAMISSGLFVLPGIAFTRAGPAIVLAYLLAGLLVIPALLAKAELATAMPRAGGTYFFVERSLGPMLGTVTGLLSWLSLSLKAAFALVGIGALGLLLFPEIGEGGVKAIAIAGCLLFAVVNLVSVKSAGRLQIILVFALLAILAAYVVRGFGAVQPQRFAPFMPAGWPSVFAVTGMVFVSFGGLTKVAAVAEEVRRPGRNLPLGMFLAFAIVTGLYVVVVFVTVGTVDAERLSGSLTPITLGAQSTMGRAGAVVVALAAFLAFATTANAGILSASRSPMAMSRDGLLPRIFSRTNRRFGTPDVAVALTAGFMILVIAFLSVEDLVKTASTMKILMFGLANVSVIVMRTSGIEGYRPSFKAPLLPWLQIAATVVYAFLIFEMGWVPLLLTGAFTLVAALWYLGYVQRRIDRQSAVVYLVKRITSSAIRRTGLEDELRRISIERDGVELDRFDRLVQDCVILDLDESMSAKEFFSRVASELAPRLQTDPESLYERFLARERESSTVIEPGLAIPHVVVDGDHVFEILLARCKGGVVFSELHEPVTTAFVLVGSADERNYHLRALMIIAHILQEPEFRQRWLKARSVEQLRDIILLSSREREGKA